MKKIFMVILSVLIIAGGVVGLYFGLRDRDSQNLEVKIYNLTVQVGQNKTIGYECSNADAIVSFNVSDENIAEIEYISQIPTIKGLKIGETEIEIVAKYKRYSNSAKAKVVVNSGVDGDDEIEISFSPLANAQVNGKEVTISKNSTAYVSFEAENVDINTWSITSEDDAIEVEKYIDASQTIQISSNVAGEYVIKLILNGSIEVKISVIVNE